MSVHTLHYCRGVSNKHCLFAVSFYTLPHNGGGVLWLYVGVRLSICCMSIHPYFHFQTITWVNVDGFSPNLVCALLFWRSDLGLLISKFHQFLTELSACNTSIVSSLDCNLSICIDIVEISGLGLLMGNFLSVFDKSYLPAKICIFVSGH